MNQRKMDEESRQSESRIDKLVSQFLLNNFPAIEHKPRYLALMPLPAVQKNKEIEDILLL
jgi:hypothetical protein